MILNCFNILDKRIRITIIEDWSDVIKYVPDFVVSNIDKEGFYGLSLAYFKGAPIFYVDIVGLDTTSNKIYNRVTLVTSEAPILEFLEILREHFVNMDDKAMTEALSKQCDIISYYNG